MGTSGRPRGRDLSTLELKHLRTLLDVRERAQTAETVYDTKIEDFVLELRQAGCTVRVIAASIGVSPTTVQAWITHAKQRRP